MFQQILFVLGAYLMGSIPTGVWYSNIVHKVDVRELGSGNSGTTNVGRNFGAKAGVSVAIIDALKGMIPMILARLLFPHNEWVIMATACASVIGHAYPIFANFKGGKIVATSVGVLLGFNFWVGVAMGLTLAGLVFLTSTVSISSMVSYSATALYLLFTQESHIYGIGFLLIALFMIYRHRDNIVRLIKKEEKRVKFGFRKAK